MKNFVLNGAAQNNKRLINVENLKSIIKNMAKCHSEEINQHTDLIDKREFNIAKISQRVTSSSLFKDLDRASIDKEIEDLESSINSIMDSKMLVKDQGIKKLVPLSYEVLSLIFISTDDYFRQRHHDELLDYYYNELCRNLNKENENVEPLEKSEFDLQVKVLLPVVKLEIACQLMDTSDPESERLQNEILSNIGSFFNGPRLNREDIFTIVRNYLRSTHYELLSYEVIPLDVRNGHLGDYFKLKIDIVFEGHEKAINVFAKFLTPKLEHMRQFVQSGPSKKEEFFYRTYLPLLEKYGLQSLLDFAPKCYFSRLNDVLVLEDLELAGFKGLTPNIKLDIDALMLTVKQIAKLHSCSIILEELLTKEHNKKTTLNNLYGEYMKECLFNNELESADERFESKKRSILYTATKFPDIINNITTNELEANINTGWNLMLEKLCTSEKFRNVLCHGDMHVANMLFKFDRKGICQDSILIDFQLLRYCPPSHDLLFFIYQNSCKETREKHFTQLVDEYYSELTKNFKSHGISIDKVFPRDDFEDSLNYMKSGSIFQAFCYSPFLTIDPLLREETFSDPETAKKYQSDEKLIIDLGMQDEHYRKTLGGLVADLIELCENGDL